MDNQINFDLDIDETKKIYLQIKNIIENNVELNNNLLKFRPSVAKGSNGVASIFVGNVLMCKIYNKSKSKYILVKKKFKDMILNDNLEYKEVKSEPNFIRICFNKVILINSIKDIVIAIFNSSFVNYSIESFGCCYRYVECSNAKHCIHPDKVFSLGCKYRENLENGEIFYGVNKNI